MFWTHNGQYLMKKMVWTSFHTQEDQTYCCISQESCCLTAIETASVYLGH